MMRFIKRKVGPILKPKGLVFLYYPGNWEGRWVYHSNIVEKCGSYYLFYSGKAGINFLAGKAFQMRQDIGVAISQNLKTWERYSGNPILKPGKGWDSDLVCHSYVFKEGDTYYMFYDGSKKGRWKESIGFAKSRNLLNWEKHPNPVLKSNSFWWDKNHVSRCCVIKDAKDKYYMFFAGHDGQRERIGMAVSGDLISWTKRKSVVVDLGKMGEWDDRFVSDPRVIKVGLLYLMTYTGFNSRDLSAGIGVCWSRDLIKWKKFVKNPIVHHGNIGDWDADEASRGDVVKFEDNYYIFYTGKKGFYYSIGFVEINMKELIKEINV